MGLMSVALPNHAPFMTAAADTLRKLSGHCLVAVPLFLFLLFCLRPKASEERLVVICLRYYRARAMEVIYAERASNLL